MQLSLFPQDEISKYEKIPDNYFGFEIFEHIFKVINERAIENENPMFRAGVASSEAAVRRLREEYYETIKLLYDNKD
jgi:hypothetical protein